MTEVRPTRRATRTAGLAIAVTAATVLAPTGAASAAAPTGEIRAAGAPTAVADSYLVVLRDAPSTVDGAADRLVSRYGGTVRQTFAAALRGFEISTSGAAARRIAADPAVAYVEQNRTVHVATPRADPLPWNLDRVDQRTLPLDGSYTYPTTASNVSAYIIDTGIRTTHGTFGGRAVSGFDSVDGGAADDCNGLGTHVAGTVGGSEYGVAKGVRLVAVRVLNCTGSGTTAGIVAGVNWVTAHAVKPAVATMTLVSGISAALDTAVTRSIGSGVTYAVSAGSTGVNACGISPARVPAAITVGATDRDDNRAPFSNHGGCLDLFAPGVQITSSWYDSPTAAVSISGASTAAAHVAGAAAIVLSAHPTYPPAQVAAVLIANATTGVVVNPGSASPNRLLYVSPAP